MNRAAITTGLAFGGLELAADWLAPAPGIGVDLGDAAISLGILALIAAGIGALPRGERWWAILLAAAAADQAGSAAGIDWLWAAAAAGAALLAIRWPRAALVFAASTALWTPIGTSRPVAAPVASDLAPSGSDLILITVDTLRADASFSPDEGSGHWRRFDQAIAASPWTLPSMYSLMTGLPVRHHGGGLPAGEGRYTRPSPDRRLLAERLAERGYATLAVVCNPHLSAELGFARGFVRFEHADDWVEPLFIHHTIQGWRRRLTEQLPRLRHLRDPLIVDRALAVFQATEGPRFLWIHLLGPHEYTRDPWTRPPGWTQGTDEPEVLRAAYAINVTAAEREVRRLIAALPDDAVIVVTSDHGESLGEDDRWGHGTSFEDAQVRVPLWIRAPSPLGPGAVASQVAAWGASDLLLREGTEMAGLLRALEVVELGGLRRDASAFALRIRGGGLSERSAPAGLGAAMDLSEETLRELRALGYVE